MPGRQDRGQAHARVARGRIETLLEIVGLADRANDKVSGYSLGMKQRLGIAAALLSDPKLLLLDEPANGLDPAGIVAMRDALRNLAATGKTIFVSSHLLAEVQQLADVVGIVSLIAYLTRTSRRAPSSPMPPTPPVDPALQILRERFARGEIAQAEFEERKRALGG